MSKTEQKIVRYLAQNPEIEKCLQYGVVNRRSLIRKMVEEKAIEMNDFEAAIGSLRRLEIEEAKTPCGVLITSVQIRLKDNISLVSVQKEKGVLKSIQNMFDKMVLERDETFKLVIGTREIKVFADKKSIIEKLKKDYSAISVREAISEMSIIFPEEVVNSKGIIAAITKEFAANDIIIEEILTASPELLIYLKGDYTSTAYKLMNDMKKGEEN